MSLAFGSHPKLTLCTRRGRKFKIPIPLQIRFSDYCYRKKQQTSTRRPNIISNEEAEKLISILHPAAFEESKLAKSKGSRRRKITALDPTLRVVGWTLADNMMRPSIFTYAVLFKDMSTNDEFWAPISDASFRQVAEDCLTGKR